MGFLSRDVDADDGDDDGYTTTSVSVSRFVHAAVAKAARERKFASAREREREPRRRERVDSGELVNAESAYARDATTVRLVKINASLTRTTRCLPPSWRVMRG